MRFQEAVRVQTSLLAPLEKRCLIWMAERLPMRVNSDHLTALAGLAMLAAGACYTFGPGRPALLVAVVVMLAVNWFGDSLDGTLARVRRHERPRYGFYVDHVLDAVSILFLITGLVLGGYMSGAIGAGFLVAYYLLTIEIALATHAVGTFRISYWKFGPTELRILLAIGTLQLLRSPWATLGGHQFLLFDVGGAVAIAGLLATFLASAVVNTRMLYRAEPLPGRTDSKERGASREGIHHRALRCLDQCKIADMILVAVDDLLFSSKIRATAKQAGVDLTFARTPEEILQQARALKPAMAIFDLNSAKADSVATVSAMKNDPELASIRVVGFVSHVQTTLIDAARKAGVDDVMARSAFAAQLGDILLAGRRP